ncbi:MAG: tRNA uridine-5-carboxymethylaminomethyl(34) synthesis GTPase MnmE [Sphingomonadales bacterium]|nr:tRNA uridine-5-carboxymethylaminomethyl(34) synthesis GTPase MnmE [Sphingomonadales bacterium]
MTDTIFALSSGAAPAAIGVVRISGPAAGEALRALTGRLPPPRRAAYRLLSDRGGAALDRALVLWLPGPGTATGEDMAELHCHGGRAVIAAVEAALADLELRRATPGEFTRRAFVNGRIDLAEAEGLADLLSAETELQRRSALAMAGGAFSRQVESWRERVLTASASVEAVLDFADEDDVATLPADFTARMEELVAEIGEWVTRPRAEMLREGYRVVLAGPPNSGKSTLFNSLVESEAAITTPVPGTTRDVLTRPVAIDGVPFLFVDTAGLREDSSDVVEAIGIERARAEAKTADLVLWLGDEERGPKGSWEIEPQIDRSSGHVTKLQARHRVSAVTGEGMAALRSDLLAIARVALPKPGEAALNRRQHELLSQAGAMLASALVLDTDDPLLVAEHLRLARVAFDALIGRSTTEDMLDALFGRFCIGK